MPHPTHSPKHRNTSTQKVCLKFQNCFKNYQKVKTCSKGFQKTLQEVSNNESRNPNWGHAGIILNIGLFLICVSPDIGSTETRRPLCTHLSLIANAECSRGCHQNKIKKFSKHVQKALF